MLRVNQLERFASNQIKLLREAKDKKTRDYQMALYAGFLSGLRLANAITQQEYNACYGNLQDLSEQLSAEQARTA